MNTSIQKQVADKAIAITKGYTGGAFYGVKETGHRINGRQKAKIGQAADDHRLLYSAFYHSRPRALGGTEDSSLLTAYYKSCISDDERGNVVAWVEKYSPWKWHKAESENGQVVKEGRFKFSKKGNAWDFELAFLNPYMLQSTKERTQKEMLGLIGVVDRLEDFMMKQRKLLSNGEKYAGGQYTDELRLLLVDFTSKLDALKAKEARSVIGIPELKDDPGSDQPAEPKQ